jgi:hypothetical protein
MGVQGKHWAVPTTNTTGATNPTRTTNQCMRLRPLQHMPQTA